jgi:uncharacterized cupin superfamily protein
MPKIDIKSLAVDIRTNYPEPLNRVALWRSRKRLGIAAELEIGTRSKRERAEYPDVGLLVIRDGARYTHKDGRPYSK